MNGSISVRSALGQGSTFSVRLRFATAEANSDDDPGTLVHGLRCRIVGSERPLGDDLAAYLAHAGATVDRSDDLVAATSATAPGGSQIWVLLPSVRVGPAELRSLAGGLASRLSVRFVVLDPDATHRPRVVTPDVVAVAAGPLFRRTLLGAVAMAADPAMAEPRPEEPERAHVLEPAGGLDGDGPRGGTILVAEDNETNRKVILRQLQLIGYGAEVCVDGREALDRWRHGDFVMLLTDLNMPEMDGRALVRTIRAEEPEGQRKPIVALTANVLREEKNALRADGFDDYLSKPVRLAQLRASIVAWLGPPQPAATPRPNPPAAPRSVDLNVLADLVGDDPAVIAEVLDAFRQSATLHAAAMTRSIAVGDTPAASDAAHKLKSGARAIGALRLGDLCERIEALATSRKAGELTALLPLFEAEWGAVVQSLDHG